MHGRNGKRVFASSLVIVYMVVVNVFSAVALWTYFVATRSRAHPMRWWAGNTSTARMLASAEPGRNAPLPATALLPVSASDTAAAESSGPHVPILAPEQHCVARAVVFVHMASGVPRALPTLNVLLRSITRQQGVLVVVAELSVFDPALREWCLMASACRIAVLPHAWRVEREDARHSVGGEPHEEDTAAPLHAVLARALEAVPTVCAHGVAVLRSGLAADVSFARRLEAVPVANVACLFAGAPALCSDEAVWVPRDLLPEALAAPGELALAERGSGGALRVLRASVELFVARAMRLQRYNGALAVVAAPHRRLMSVSS